MEGLDRNIVGSAAEPAMRFIPNVELMENERKEAEARQSTKKITGLAAYVTEQWQSAKRTKELIEYELIANQRQRNGTYEKDKLTQIRKQGGTEVFLMLTAAKCRAAEAWIKDIVMNGQDEPFNIKPSKIPELSDEEEARLQQEVYLDARRELEQMALMDGIITHEEIAAIEQQLMGRMERLNQAVIDEITMEAEKSADKMQVKIIDQFQEGGFSEQLEQVIYDIVTFKAGFMKGPMVRKRSKLEWKQGLNGFQPVETDEFVLEYERVSPFDIYPSPDSSGIDDGYLIHRQKLTVGSLNALKGVDGYDEGAINGVIEDYGKGGLRTWLSHDYERAENEDKPYEYLNPSSIIEAIGYNGKVPGLVLLEHGFTEEDIDDPTNDYEVNVLMIGTWVIKASINANPLKSRPYSKACYENVAGSFWGRGVPELMEDIQQITNATARALINNLAIASGPQVAVNDTNRIPTGEDIESIYPWKIWQFTPDIKGNGQRPIDFFQPNIMTTQLLEVYSYFSKLADDYTGIPAFVQGNDDAKGAGKTASGMSMIMTHASRGIKDVIAHIDRGIIEPIVKKTYIHNMLFDEDETIKGDVDIQAKGALSLFNKEQAQVRRNEFLLATNNPVDLSITGKQGRAAVLREVAKALDMPIDEIVPDDEAIEAQVMQEQQMMQMQSLDPAGNPVSGQDTKVF